VTSDETRFTTTARVAADLAAVGSATTGLPRQIAVIAIDPFDSQHVLVGGIGLGRLASRTTSAVSGRRTPAESRGRG
jgi:phenylpyruvate tautomerase PptA (4-oxalocrotonate tautomerase family)